MLAALLNLGFAGGQAAAPQPEQETVLQGGHYWPDVEPQDWRQRSHDERRRILERIISGAREAPAEVREEVAEIVQPYKRKRGRVDVTALAANVEAVDRLIRAYQDYLDDDDAALVLLMG